MNMNPEARKRTKNRIGSFAADSAQLHPSLATYTVTIAACEKAPYLGFGIYGPRGYIIISVGLLFPELAYGQHKTLI